VHALMSDERVSGDAVIRRLLRPENAYHHHFGCGDPISLTNSHFRYGTDPHLLQIINRCTTLYI
jgi:hypothetical protein